MRVGAHKYGKWDPDTEKRNMKTEAIDELLDCINYCVMAIQILNKKYKPCTCYSCVQEYEKRKT